MAGEFRSRPKDPIGPKKGTARWWMPLFGLFMAVILVVFALMVSPILRDNVWWDWAQVRDLRAENEAVIPTTVKGVCSPTLGEDWCWGVVDLGVSLVIFVLAFGFVMTLFFAFAGRDPAEKRAREVTRMAEKEKQAEKRRKRKGQRKKVYRRK